MTIGDPDSSEMLLDIHADANRRKVETFWIGFLQGALSSGRVSDLEQAALECEARNFSSFFDDRDAYDLAEDITHQCFAGDADIGVQLGDIILWVRERHEQTEGDPGKDAINEFLGFCAGVVCDGLVHEPEARAMLAMLETQHLNGCPEFATLINVLNEALEDNVLSEEEAEEIREWIARLVGDGYAYTGLPVFGTAARPPGMITDHTEVLFPEKRFVITGPMRYGTRRKIMTDIERIGGIASTSVSKKVDYVAVAYEASIHWKAVSYGTKVERAHKLVAEGHPLTLVEELAFERALTLAIENHVD